MAAGEAPAGTMSGPGLELGAEPVALWVSSNLNSFRTSKRYSTGLTIAELKCKLELLVGSPASCMALELYDPRDEFLGPLDCDEALLGSYPVADGCRLHVIDRSGARAKVFEDVSQVEKYEMPDAEYDKRAVLDATPCLSRPVPDAPPVSPLPPPESLRSFLRQRRLGRWAGEQRLAQEAALATALPLGARCQVQVAGQPCKRGTIMYVGQTDFKPGCWVGVRYDKPLGKNDGSVNGRRYFECEPKYGAFVKPQAVTPGDFPEEKDDEL
ncbi:tubulin-folding cofactor B-like [Aegotheles albertisi]